MDESVHPSGDTWPDRDPWPDRDTQLAERLLAVSELMATTGDRPAVFGLVAADCVDLLPVRAAGILVARGGGLRLVAAVGTGAGPVEAMHLPRQEGPSVDVVASGEDVDVSMADARRRWPSWGEAADALGVRRVTALPLRLVGGCVGALELHLRGDEPLSVVDHQVARTFAGLAMLAAHHDAQLSRTSTRVRQLETALESRIVVEQAKGFLVAHGCGHPSEAFEVMRAFSRRSGRRLHTVAGDLLSGRLDPILVCGDTSTRRSPHTG